MCNAVYDGFKMAEELADINQNLKKKPSGRGDFFTDFETDMET